MDATTLKEARVGRKWTQQHAARALGVTQGYWSMMEKGRRRLPRRFVRKALKVLRAPVTAVPLPEGRELDDLGARRPDFSAELGALGYPGFAYLKKAPSNPALVLIEALNQPNLDARVTEGLPWLALTYGNMDWDWLLRTAKLHDRQNRLAFAVALAHEVAERRQENDRVVQLVGYLEQLEPARLAREDTFCRDGMTQTERKWLRKHRSRTAAHWNLLTDMRGDHLAYE